VSPGGVLSTWDRVAGAAGDSVAASRIARRVAAATSAVALLDQIAAGAAALLAAEGVVVARLAGTGFRVDAATGSLIPMIGFHAPLAATLAEEALLQGQPMVANDAASDPRVSVHFLSAFAPRQVAIAPLVAGDQPQGFILALNSCRGAFDAPDAATLQRLADYAAIALSRAEPAARAGGATAAGRDTGDAIRQMNQSLEPERVAAVLAEHAVATTGARGARVLLIDDAGVSIAATAGDATDPIGYLAEPDGYLGMRAIAERRPVGAGDLRTCADQWARPATGPGDAGCGQANGLAVPLLVGGAAIGAVTVFGKEQVGGDFDSADEAALQVLADHAALAVESARLRRTASAMTRHANVLAAVARSLARSNTPEAVLTGVFEVARDALGAHGVSVFLADPATRRVDLAYSEGAGAHIINWTANRFWSLPVGTVTASGVPFYANTEAAMHNGLTPDEVPRYRAAGIKSLALLPLPDGGQRGTIVLRFTSMERFDPAARRLLEDFAAQVAIAIRNAQLVEGERSARERERALAESVHQTDKLAALGELVAGVAHELNNPLTGISAFAQLLLEEPLTEEQAEAAREIKRESDRAVSVISDLLIFSRKTGPRQLPVDLNAVVQQSLRLRAYTLQSSGIATKTELDASAPTVLGDERKLQQVLLNLVVNAEYAMRRSEQRLLTVRTATREIAGSVRAIIEVVDTGNGMGPDVAKHIFEPFFTTKPPGVGTGLGLSVSYGIVQGHGGTIEVRTAPAAGSTFSVILPLYVPSGGTLHATGDDTARPTIPRDTPRIGIPLPTTDRSRDAAGAGARTPSFPSLHVD